ncbi:MAG: ankyrin repeat domain-containing protein [Alphaproteobacteria bacterium]|nr:ankyrin repeat domain-containing protein [Alphaproteobacteria bacterium]
MSKEFMEAYKNNYEEEETNMRLISELFPMIQKKQNDILRMFFKKYPSKMLLVSNSRHTTLYTALKAKNYEMMEYLMHRVPHDARLSTGDTFLDFRNAEGCSVLMEAVKDGDIKAVRMILRHNPNLEIAEYDNKEKAIHLAAETGNIAIFKILMNEKKKRGEAFDIDEKSQKCGYTSLHIASDNGDLEMVKFLIHAGADVNKRTMYGRTPAILAVANEKMDVYNYLASLPQVDLTAKENTGKTVEYFLNPRNRLEERKDDFDKFMDTLSGNFTEEESEKLIKEFFENDDEYECPVVVKTHQNSIIPDTSKQRD